MSDVSELVGRLRGPIKHPQQSASLRLEAADALEVLAGEMAQMRETIAGYEANERQLERWLESAESRLAKLAPVVEAAKALDDDSGLQSVAGWYDSLANLRQALATLEATHD